MAEIVFVGKFPDKIRMAFFRLFIRFPSRTLLFPLPNNADKNIEVYGSYLRKARALIDS